MRRFASTPRVAIVTVACLAMMAPLYWLVSASFKSNLDLFAIPPQWVPLAPVLDHYAEALDPDGSFLVYLRNSGITVAASTAIALVLGICAAYGFARYRFRFSGGLLFVVLAIRMIAPASLVLPYFTLMRYLGLLDTTVALVIVYTALELPLITWIAQGFFRDLPSDVLEAAELDGLPAFRVLWRVAVPMSLPAVGAAGMFGFVTAWNELLYALTLTRTPAAQTMSVAIAGNVNQYANFWGQMSASAVIYVIPAILVALFAQKGIVRGLMAGSGK